MTVSIPLRDRHGELVAHTLIDDEDAHLAQLRWYRSPQGYATRTTGMGPAKRLHYLHRVVLNAPPGTEVDHLNHDGLDNRRCNIRVTDKSGNMQNRGPRPGRMLPRNVYTTTWGKYRVAVSGKHVGYFRTVEQADRAARAYRAENLPMSADAAELAASR